MVNKVVEAYDAGKITEAMTMELSISEAIVALNALYEHSTHRRSLFNYLSPIFGSDYVFTKKDLRISAKVEDPCILFRDIDKNPIYIYYVCIPTIVLLVLSKAIQTKRITHERYKLLAEIFLREKFIDHIIDEQEKRENAGAAKPLVSKILAKSENERLHPELKSKRKRGHKHRPHLIYTPMGNKR